MMIKILCTKDITGNPADGIDNFTKMIFGRMNDPSLSFYVRTPSDFEEIGAVKSLRGSKTKFLLLKKPDYLWGIGNVREIFFALMKSRETKYIINFHTILIKDNGSWNVRTPWFLRKLLFSCADMIVCPSEFSAKSVRKYFPNQKVISILNGVDDFFFHPSKRNPEYLAREYDIDFSRPLVVFAGTLQPRKRPNIFIEIAKRCEEANFVMIGRRVLPHNFLAETRGLKNFQWIEKMSREDIAIFFASSDIFVFPSLNEPSAAVILEAMASGCVPILSASGGNVEFFEDGEEGYFVSVGGDNEVKDFVKRIHTLIKNESMHSQMSRAARKRAEAHTAQRTVTQYQELFLNRV